MQTLTIWGVTLVTLGADDGDRRAVPVGILFDEPSESRPRRLAWVGMDDYTAVHEEMMAVWEDRYAPWPTVEQLLRRQQSDGPRIPS